jgi:hypothetical protein
VYPHTTEPPHTFPLPPQPGYSLLVDATTVSITPLSITRTVSLQVVILVWPRFYSSSQWSPVVKAEVAGGAFDPGWLEPDLFVYLVNASGASDGAAAWSAAVTAATLDLSPAAAFKPLSSQGLLVADGIQKFASGVPAGGSGLGEAAGAIFGVLAGVSAALFGYRRVAAGKATNKMASHGGRGRSLNSGWSDTADSPTAARGSSSPLHPSAELMFEPLGPAPGALKRSMFDKVEPLSPSIGTGAAQGVMGLVGGGSSPRSPMKVQARRAAPTFSTAVPRGLQPQRPALSHAVSFR